ncbi:hypothetical protein HDK77DRAFT_508334 [Phyllosticta capitalensis]
MSHNQGYEQSTKSIAHYAQRAHLSSQQVFLKDVQGAIDKAIPVDSPSFGRVAVLSMTWDNETTDTRLSECKLLSVLRDEYGFECTSKRICSDMDAKAEFWVQKQVVEFRTEWDTEDALLIFIYSGHAALDGNFNLFLTANPQADGDRRLTHPRVPWVAIKHFMKSSGRSLCILDCCYAAAASLNERPQELLGASGFNRSSHNFLNLLSTHLQDLKGKPRSVSQIFCDLIRNRQLKTIPVHSFDGTDPFDGTNPFDVTNQSVVLSKRSQQTGRHHTLTAEDQKDALLAMGESNSKVLVSISISRGEEDPIPGLES